MKRLVMTSLTLVLALGLLASANLEAAFAQ